MGSAAVKWGQTETFSSCRAGEEIPSRFGQSKRPWRNVYGFVGLLPLFLAPLFWKYCWGELTTEDFELGSVQMKCCSIKCTMKREFFFFFNLCTIATRCSHQNVSGRTGLITLKVKQPYRNMFVLSSPLLWPLLKHLVQTKKKKCSDGLFKCSL